MWLSLTSSPIYILSGIALLDYFFFSYGVAGYFLDDVKSLHMEDIIRIYCPPNNNAQFLDCVDRTRKNIRSLKLGEFYSQKPNYLNEIHSMLNTYNYQMAGDGSDLSLANGAVNYHRKLTTLQDVADDKRVRTICEIGFLGGYTSLNFLVSNPDASLFIFDGDQHEKYSKVIVNSLLHQFPNRLINIFTGELGYTLRNFHEQFGHVTKCNLLLIDGRQDEESLMTILKHMIPLMDPVFNRIIVDNFEQPSIQNIYYYYTNKINVGVNCPMLNARYPTIPAVADATAVEVAATGVDGVTAAALAQGATPSTIHRRSDLGNRKGCPYKIDTVQLVKGATYTPCVAMYAEQANGLHMEFVFSLQNCRADPIPEGEIMEYAEDESLEMLVATVDYYSLAAENKRKGP